MLKLPILIAVHAIGYKYKDLVELRFQVLLLYLFSV